MQAVSTTPLPLHDESDIRAFIPKPPTLAEMLSNPVLRSLFKWHMISLYCPESIMFREAVEEFRRSFGSGDGKDLAQSICAQFCSAESSMEVNLPLNMKETLQKGANNPRIDMFDAALVIADKDSVRSLQGFYSTEVFLSYFQHRALLDVLFHVSEAPTFDLGTRQRNRAETIGSHASKEEVISAVRGAYNLGQPFSITRIFDVASPFHFSVNASGTQVGWAVQRGNFFYFFDMQEVEICKVSGAALLGKASLEPVSQESANRGHDDDVAQAGCCGSSPPMGTSSSPALAAGRRADGVEGSSWYIRDPLNKVHGPFDQARILLWWCYHLLPLETDVSSDNKQWTAVGELPDIFHPGKRIEMFLLAASTMRLSEPWDGSMSSDLISSSVTLDPMGIGTESIAQRGGLEASNQRFFNAGLTSFAAKTI